MKIVDKDRMKRLTAYAGKIYPSDDVIRDIVEITSRGNDAIVKHKGNGRLEVYESLIRKPKRMN